MEWAGVGAGLAIGLAGLGVCLGEGITAAQSLGNMGKGSTKLNLNLVMTILFIALVESAAIYGLIVAFQLSDVG